MKYLRWLLFPFSLIYGLIVIIRNWFYDAGLFKSHKFNIPIISIGNLEAGGAGKSPMTEYLIRLLKNDYKLATLSRGYGRETKDYQIVNMFQGVSTVSNVLSVSNETPATAHLNTQQSSLAAQIGDEPAQFHQKFPDITVAVCEDRAAGIKQLLPNHNLILLDDAYQHRAVTAGLSILLFDYNRINQPHLLLPAGNMREPFSGRWRAQVIIVSKCPAWLGNNEQVALANKIAPLPYQSLFFTSIAYQGLQDMDGKAIATEIDKDTTIFLLTGIANAAPLVKHLNNQTSYIIHHNYPDHHPFTLKNIAKLAAEFTACSSQKKMIITTEKDAQRLDKSWFNTGLPANEKLPVFAIPIRVAFLNGNGQQFDQLVIDYVREHTAHNSIH